MEIKRKEVITVEQMDQNKCCGCEACSNICPVNAIQFLPDELGFYYPKVDAGKCTLCGLCSMKCPQLNTIKSRVNSCDIFAGYALDDSIVENSSSGGLFTVLAENFLNSYHDSSVVAVIWAEDYKSVYHTFGKLEDIESMRRSKYIQSHKGYIYREIKKRLDSGENILFIGCPCEVGGLMALLGDKNYNNLFLIDLVCQGPTSPKVMEEYVDLLEQKYHSKIKDINLRFNGGRNWIPQWIKVRFQNGEQYIRVFYETELGVAVHYMQRAACYSCQWNGNRRQSDITLGDYHSADERADYYNNKGTSIAIINSSKGKELMELISSQIILIRADYADVVAKNPRVENSWDPLPGTRKFVKYYKKYHLRKAVRKALPIKQKIKFMFPVAISQIINHQIKGK